MKEIKALKRITTTFKGLYPVHYCHLKAVLRIPIRSDPVFLGHPDPNPDPLFKNRPPVNLLFSIFYVTLCIIQFLQISLHIFYRLFLVSQDVETR